MVQLAIGDAITKQETINNKKEKVKEEKLREKLEKKN